MRISFADKLSKMVPQSETKAKILASCWDNKDLGTMKLRFRDDHDTWNWKPLVTRCQLSESKSWKKPVGRKNFAGRPKAILIRLSERYQQKHPSNHPIPVYEVRLFELAVMGTYVSVIRHLSVSYRHVICYEKQEDTSKLEKLCSGKRLLDENENQKMKQKIRVQVA